MKTVFQPLNLQMEKAIVANSQLVIGDDLPRVFQLLIAHTEAYNAIVAGWKDADFEACSQATEQSVKACPQLESIRNAVTPLNYPDQIMQCVSDDYKRLKERQQDKTGIWGLYPGGKVERSKACD